jgi:ABC-2 type transport system permease protein
MLILGYFIKLFFSILIGFIAFWTTEIQGIYFFLNILKKFLAGAYFPVALMPIILYKISTMFPFIYTLYFPAQLYLGKISTSEGLKGLGIEIIWLLILYILIKIVWRLGRKKYEGVGI